MAEYNFELRGWHALVAIATLLGLSGIQIYSRVRTVDDGMRNALRERLLNEYSGRGPKDIARIVERLGEAVEQQDGVGPMADRGRGVALDPLEVGAESAP